MQDRELVKRVLDGDGPAQRELYDRHVEQIYRLAYRMTGDETCARDCTQMAFIQLFDKLTTFRGEATLSTWVHAVAVSVILQWRRKTAQQRERETGIESAQHVNTRSCSFDGIVNEAIRRAIDALASPYRTIVVMHDIEGYTHEEISAALGIAAGTSRVRLSRARQQLRAALADYAGDLAYE